MRSTTFGRPSRHSLVNGNTLKELPYVENNYVLGMSIMDAVVSSPAQRMSLMQRINGTAKSGSDRRERINAQSMFYVNHYGQVCYGDYYTGMHFVSTTYGSDGLMVNKISKTRVGQILFRLPLPEIKNRYFTPKEIGTGTKQGTLRRRGCLLETELSELRRSQRSTQCASAKKPA
eukprot:Seg1859.5 transcript_id=Seg1859.5/GoldUCD/mRNA.D3Y31 product="hypothetical protein" protein_id=Seg1859.5/GoldUCD/D3Y31